MLAAKALEQKKKKKLQREGSKCTVRCEPKQKHSEWDSEFQAGGGGKCSSDRLERLEIRKGTLISESTVQSTDSRQLALSSVVQYGFRCSVVLTKTKTPFSKPYYFK